MTQDQRRWAALMQIGALNTRLGHTYSTDGGKLVHGVIEIDPNWGELTYQASFPYCTEKQQGFLPESRFVDYIAVRNVSDGGGMGTINVKAKRYRGRPDKFAAAIQQVALPGIQIQWHYYQEPLRPGAQEDNSVRWSFRNRSPRFLGPSAKLDLTAEQLAMFRTGELTEATAKHKLEYDPFAVFYNNQWQAWGHLVTFVAYTDGTFRYTFASHRM